MSRGRPQADVSVVRKCGRCKFPGNMRITPAMKARHKWYITGSVALVGCLCWFIFLRNETMLPRYQSTAPELQHSSIGSETRHPSPPAAGDAGQAATLALVPTDSDDASPDMRDDWHARRCYSSRGYGALVDPQGVTLVVGTKELPIIQAVSNADRSLFLVHHGNGRYTIYNANGEKVENAPGWETGGTGGITWHWRDDSSLVGSLERTPPLIPNSYPETDARPESVELYGYTVGSGGNPLRMATPPVSDGLLIRLEKVTANGELVLSEVSPDNFYGGAAISVLGKFRIEQ